MNGFSKLNRIIYEVEILHLTFNGGNENEEKIDCGRHRRCRPGSCYTDIQCLCCTGKGNSLCLQCCADKGKKFR